MKRARIRGWTRRVELNPTRAGASGLGRPSRMLGDEKTRAIVGRGPVWIAELFISSLGLALLKSDPADAPIRAIDRSRCGITSTMPKAYVS